MKPWLATVALGAGLLLVWTAACKPKAPTQVACYGYEIVNTFPHATDAFTEGLLYLDGNLLESTGLCGQSSLRLVDLRTGKVLRQTNLPDSIFGEGLAALDDKLYQLTWTNGIAFVYDLKTFAREKEFTYNGQGWGLTTDGRWLIMSDGTAEIRFLDPTTFKTHHKITVRLHGEAETHINELEYVQGKILANKWATPYVYRIDPGTGDVEAIVDFSDLLTWSEREHTDVFNGIAYDAADDRLFVTGKYWPKLFEVRLKKLN